MTYNRINNKTLQIPKYGHLFRQQIGVSLLLRLVVVRSTHVHHRTTGGNPDLTLGPIVHTTEPRGLGALPFLQEEVVIVDDDFGILRTRFKIYDT